MAAARFRDGWVWLLLTVAARAYLAFIVTMAVAAIVPALGPWDSYVVRTGSMAPHIDPGDVVVSSPLAADEDVPLGRVVVFAEPASEAGVARTIVHRVVSDHPGGTFVTAGDANPRADSTLLVRERVLGQGRLLVPFVGLPTVWVTTGAWLPFVWWLLLSLVAVAVSAMTPTHRPGQQGPGPSVVTGPRAGTDPSELQSFARASGIRLDGPTSGILRSGAFALVLVVTAALVVQAASAAFSATARSPGDRWASTSRILLSYPKSVLTDNPWGFYLFDESTGPSALDLSGNSGRSGTYAGTVTYKQSGSGTTSPGTSVLFGVAGSRMVTGGAAITGPTTFSLELWMKSTSTSGGKLVGFESTTAATSSKYDRHLFMRNTGVLVYGGWTGGTQRLIVTPKAYNDGAWHHVVLAARANGSSQTSTIYVDGAAVVTGTTTQLSTYSGWWRVGYGTLATGSSYPTSADFEGTIDNVAIYATELASARVLAHYNAR